METAKTSLSLSLYSLFVGVKSYCYNHDTSTKISIVSSLKYYGHPFLKVTFICYQFTKRPRSPASIASDRWVHRCHRRTDWKTINYKCCTPLKLGNSTYRTNFYIDTISLSNSEFFKNCIVNSYGFTLKKYNFGLVYSYSKSVRH